MGARAFELAEYLVVTQTVRTTPSKSRRAVLYEAVARGVHVLRENVWPDEINQNLTVVVAVREPEVEHKVRVREFENWLTSSGTSPVEQALKNDLRSIIGDRIERKRAEIRPSSLSDRAPLVVFNNNYSFEERSIDPIT